MPQETLEKLRKSIDTLDQEIVSLIKRRAAIAMEIGTLKKKSGITGVFSSTRECNVFKMVSQQLRVPYILNDEHIRRIYAEIISVCRDIQAPIKVYTYGKMPASLRHAVNSRFGYFVSIFNELDCEFFLSNLESEAGSFGVIAVDDMLNFHLCVIKEALEKGSLKIVEEFECSEAFFYILSA